ncbi:polysaccharide deacetylase family protein [Litorilituus lipolyticus]|uniref:NodB homology domain-containing protein n=1 Tax=Litorilituus lipolyticus TaxID=2491017 RepID=A0A502KQ58_9GAMM|nr:polysaccharide deacetylase family protein [Litorilituus lipolyticus]TPH13294.1 hypothetical protein EPA86_13960 [Litorilituus lipolyticus]
MLKAIKIAALFAIKSIGGFWIARQLNKKNTCVLCYHGFAYRDEYKFRPKLFMRPETFAQRMQWLANSPYQVISLSDAIKKQSDDSTVVLTMDDGWAATQELVGETLAKHQLTMMLYVTSYYAQKQGAVINVALAYLLWRSIGKTLVVENDRLKGTHHYDITADNITDIVTKLCHAIDANDDFDIRQKILMEIADKLSVNLYEKEQLMFRSLNVQELSAIHELYLDIQLHTHRHCSPQDEARFKEEITQNIEFLQQAKVKGEFQHFCFPSGENYVPQLPWLKGCGIKTATTTVAGMLTPTTNHLQIPRFLDGEDVHQLEFEAELCGLASFLRKLLNNK